MLLDLHTDFSGGRSGGLVFPFLEDFPKFVAIHTVKLFGIVNKAEIDVFLEVSGCFGDPMDIGNLISVSSDFSEFSITLEHWKFTVHVLLKSDLENFKHYFASV